MQKKYLISLFILSLFSLIIFSQTSAKDKSEPKFIIQEKKFIEFDKKIIDNISIEGKKGEDYKKIEKSTKSIQSRTRYCYKVMGYYDCPSAHEYPQTGDRCESSNQMRQYWISRFINDTHRIYTQRGCTQERPFNVWQWID